MLKFSHTTILFLLILVVSWFGALPWWVFALAVIIYSLLLVWGSIRVDSQFYMDAICKGDESQPAIAISFDDGPLQQYTGEILDTLAQYRVPACFFCIGQRALAKPELCKRIVDEGHTIGNHSYSHHALFDLFSSGRMLKELTETNKQIELTTGKKIRFFRPPYGVTNPNLAKAVKKAGLTTIGWNIRSMDTVEKLDARLLNKLLGELRPGAIVLLHDTMAITNRILPQFIEAVKKRGFQIVPIEQLIDKKAYE